MSSHQTFSDSVKMASDQGGRMLMPLVDKLLPRVASIRQQDLLADSVQWGRAIMQTTDLVGGDSIAICVDPDITLLGCGATLVWDKDNKRCAGEINLSDSLDTEGLSQYLQMLDGVVKSPLRDKPCAVAMLGPATLVNRIFSEEPSKARFNEVKGHLTALAEKICQLLPELIMFIEDDAVLKQTNLQDLRRIYNTLGNVANYYEVGSALLTDAITPDQAQALSKLNLDALIVSDLSTEEELSTLLSATEKWSLLGLPLPINDPNKIQAWQLQIDAASTDSDKLFYITPGQLPQGCDLEQLRKLKKQISAGEC